jgi:hypothetical protein
MFEKIAGALSEVGKTGTGGFGGEFAGAFKTEGGFGREFADAFRKDADAVRIEKDSGIDVRTVLTDAEKAKIREAHPDWPDKIVDSIATWNEYEIFDKAGLKYAEINGRDCLIRPDIDLDYVDPKTGETNRERMAKGRAPIDSRTGEKITLHHIGQKFDSPLAELTEFGEHGKVPHISPEPSWRKNPDGTWSEQNKIYDVQRSNHWKARSKEMEA